MPSKRWTRTARRARRSAGRVDPETHSHLCLAGGRTGRARGLPSGRARQSSQRDSAGLGGSPGTRQPQSQLCSACPRTPSLGGRRAREDCLPNEWGRSWNSSIHPPYTTSRDIIKEVSNSSIVVVCVCLGGAYFWLVIGHALRRARRSGQNCIVAQLRKRGSFEVAVKSAGAAWDPSGSGKRVFGRGLATYTLDESGTVHLRWQPRQGAERTYVGPIPDPPAPKMRRLLRFALAGYLALLVLGFLLGFLTSSGSVGTRLLWACGGLAVAMIAVVVAVHVILVAKSVTSLRTGSRSDQHQH